MLCEQSVNVRSWNNGIFKPTNKLYELTTWRKGYFDFGEISLDVEAHCLVFRFVQRTFVDGISRKL